MTSFEKFMIVYTFTSILILQLLLIIKGFQGK